ncbi:hypothetical protein HOG48_00705 [Candidatus Peregrinibacteria bacterium]|jgi:hypothetical protein|nr:hypothetical protein [Candidatus Peregrinibacteria bacterium]
MNDEGGQIGAGSGTGQTSGGGSGQGSGAGVNVNPHVINLQGVAAPGGSGGDDGTVADAELKAKMDKFGVPEDMRGKYPTLIGLVLETESMTDDERQYWFQIMPIMTEKQLMKFQGILETEKKQLAKLDDEYEEQLKKLNNRHLIEWQEFESREKKREIETAEKEAEIEEQKTEDDLLKQLDDI